MLQGSPTTAVHYFTKGAQLIVQPGYRRYVLVPLLVNVIFFVALTYALVHLLSSVMGDVKDWLPTWLTWLSWLLWPLVGFVFLVGYGYSFNLITNIIAAPFYGFLVEKIQAERLGLSPRDETLSEMIPRTLLREMTKLWYFLSRGLLVLAVFIALFFIPGVNLLGSLIWAIWGAWCMSVQYLDYPADTNRVSFRQMRRTLNQQPLTSYSYGGLILAGSMVPVLNIFVSPIAVAGAAIYWIEEVGVEAADHAPKSQPSTPTAPTPTAPARLPRP